MRKFNIDFCYSLATPFTALVDGVECEIKNHRLTLEGESTSSVLERLRGSPPEVLSSINNIRQWKYRNT